MLDTTLDLWSDGAMLCLFDPAGFEPRPATHAGRFEDDQDLREGRYGRVLLQGDGTYRVRLTEGDLTEQERELLNDEVGPLGLVVQSGEIYVSGMDVPGEPMETYADHGAGQCVPLPPGEYDLIVHELDLDRAVTDSELTEYVITLRPRTEPFPILREEPQFSGGQLIEQLLADLDRTD